MVNKKDLSLKLVLINEVVFMNNVFFVEVFFDVYKFVGLSVVVLLLYNGKIE